jgi:proton-coupled amino acid transporter
VAVTVTNVQALTSLVGALAGSSTALLIPPMLELAWIEHKKDDSTVAVVNDNDEQKCFGIIPAYWLDKTKCYILLVLGFLFFAIKTYSSMVDIVRIYQSGKQ